MKSTLTMALGGLLLLAVPFAGSDSAEAQGRGNHGRARIESHDRDGYRYWTDRDIRIVREYYRPNLRNLPPGLQRRYRRTGQLPPGWAKRVQPMPVYVERRLPRLPRGYQRGVVDGRAIIYGPGGMVFDIAVLF